MVTLRVRGWTTHTSCVPASKYSATFSWRSLAVFEGETTSWHHASEAHIAGFGLTFLASPHQREPAKVVRRGWIAGNELPGLRR
jgi:hypothetical protein